MYAAKILEDEEGADGGKKKAKGGQASLMADDRFKTMFEDPAFAIDERAEEYKVLHPNAGQFVWDVYRSLTLILKHNEVVRKKRHHVMPFLSPSSSHDYSGMEHTRICLIQQVSHTLSMLTQFISNLQRVRGTRSWLRSTLRPWIQMGTNQMTKQKSRREMVILRLGIVKMKMLLSQRHMTRDNRSRSCLPDNKMELSLEVYHKHDL